MSSLCDRVLSIFVISHQVRRKAEVRGYHFRVLRIGEVFALER